MGCIQSLTNASQNQNLSDTKNLLLEKLRYNATYRLLLLGPGDTGKTTFIKQILNKYKHGYPEEERVKYTESIAENIITSVKTIMRCSERLDNIDLGGNIADHSKAPDKEFLLEYKWENGINKDVVERIQKFWRNDNEFMKKYENCSKYQLLDTAEYFLDKLDEIAEEKYIPSNEDIFHCRTVTAGVVEVDIQLDNCTFKMIDVGGQRSQRKKWVHCFKGVTGVLFFASLSEYDQMLYEENTQKRMDETLNLFDDICNSNWFRDTNIILFLNKKDLFDKKIKRVPVTNYFSEYNGDPQNSEEAIDHIKTVFKARAKTRSSDLYTYVTTATDSKNFDFVFNAVKDIILKTNLKFGGFI